MDEPEVSGPLCLNQTTTTTTTTTTTMTTATTEGLRQRQLDRRAPRSGPAKNPATTTLSEVGEDVKVSARLGAAPRTKVTPMAMAMAMAMGTATATAPGKMAGEGPSRINHLNETSGPGDRDMATMHSRAKGSSGEGRMEGEGTAAAKEGRQFTVSKVGNNGRIYLRYVTATRIPPARCLGRCTASMRRLRRVESPGLGTWLMIL